MRCNHKIKKFSVKPDVVINRIIAILVGLAVAMGIWFILSWANVIVNNLQADLPLAAWNLFDILV